MTARSHQRRARSTVLPPAPRGRRDDLTACIPLTRLKPVRGWTFTVPDLLLYLGGTLVWAAAAVIAAWSVLGFFGVLQ